MPSADSHLDWLLVGTGDIVNKRVAPALVAANHSRLLCVVGQIDRARAIAARFNVPEASDNLEQALRTTNANAVYIATPVDRHREEAIHSLQAGKHVLVEKPLALNAQDAADIVQAAQAAGLRAGCAYYRRFFPRFEQARQMLAEGDFGRIISIDTCYHGWFNPQPDDPKIWRVQHEKSGGGPLADMGSHAIDILIGLFGFPSNVFAHVRTLVQPYEVEDTAAALMQTSDGASITASFSWCSQTWAHRFEIVGEKARLRWDPHDTGKVIKTVGRETTELDLPNAQNVHLPLVQDFIDAVRQNREPRVSVAEAAKTNRVIDAIYQSSRERREVAP